MSTGESVSRWVEQLEAGDRDAAQALWERYFQRLVGLARVKLRGARRAVADEEDVALSAFDSFCRGAERGRFPALGDRNDLWRLLVVITERKAIGLRRHDGRLKRGGGAAHAEPAASDDSAGPAGLDAVAGPEPTPELAAQVADECRRLLDLLREEGLRSIALWKMEGDTTEEIAARLGCAPRTVERKLRLIRSRWGAEEG
jgi:DNA-directed RNA polymerase specialized sigma24 family protein